MDPRAKRALLVAGGVALAAALGVGGYFMFRAPADVRCETRGTSVHCRVAPRGGQGERVRVCWSTRARCANGSSTRVWSCVRTRVGAPVEFDISVERLRNGRAVGVCDRPVAVSVRRVRKKPYEDEE
jgi:hypothetical protein